MRILTGGHAIWMGGWSGQVHHGRDVIDTECATPGALMRSEAVVTVLRAAALETGETGEVMLPPAWALADGIVHDDHRVMPPDEIDPDYLDRDEGPALRAALAGLGMPPGRIDAVMATYGAVLNPDGVPTPR